MTERNLNCITGAVVALHRPYKCSGATIHTTIMTTVVVLPAL
jgi:hypothetical protein